MKSEDMDAIDELRRRNLMMRLEAAILGDLQGFVDKLNTEALQAEVSEALVASVSRALDRFHQELIRARLLTVTEVDHSYVEHSALHAPICGIAPNGPQSVVLRRSCSKCTHDVEDHQLVR